MLTAKPSARGFTLVELVVAIALMAILLATVIPDVRDWVRGLKVRNAAESLRNGLELARMEALKRNAAVTFWTVADAGSRVPGNSCALSSSSPAWVVSVTDPSGSCGAAASLTDAPQLVQRSAAVENVNGLTVSASSATGAAATQVRFNGLGQVQAQAGIAAIQAIDVSLSGGGARRLRVQVESGGAIRMCDLDVAASDPRACPAL